MIETFLAKFALQAVVGFYQKNPWAILPTLVLGALPVILVVSLVLGLIGGLVHPIQANENVSCNSQTGAVDSLFKDTDVSSYTAQRNSLYSSKCAQYGDSTGVNSYYDYDAWSNILSELQALVGKPYDQAKLDSIQQEAIDASGVNMTGKGAIQQIKDTIKKEFQDIEDANKNNKSVWPALVDWAKGYVNESLGASEIGAKIVAAARTRLGEDYITAGTGTWNADKQCYSGPGGTCGFDCARLAGWAWAQAVGVKTTAASEPAQPYGSIGSSALYGYILNNKLGYVIDEKDAQPGDFVFTKSDSRTTATTPGLVNIWDHTAIYEKQVSTGSKPPSNVAMYLEAPNPSAKVRETQAWWGSFQHVMVRLYAADESAVAAKDYSVANAQAYAKSYMASRYGWGDNQYACLVPMWNRESSWNYVALNPKFSPSHPATPEYQAYGIPQAGPGAKMATAGADWKTNYATQIKWGLGYIQAQYDTPCKAWAIWQTQGWY